MRKLNLTWGDNIRQGKTHEEHHAPCGCAYHPEGRQGPHIHHCPMHKVEDDLQKHPWLEQAATIDAMAAKQLRHDIFSNEHIYYLSVALSGEVGGLSKLVRGLWLGGWDSDIGILDMEKSIANITINLYRLAAVLNIDIDKVCNNILGGAPPLERSRKILREDLENWECNNPDCKGKDNKPVWEWVPTSNSYDKEETRIYCVPCGDIYTVLDEEKEMLDDERNLETTEGGGVSFISLDELPESKEPGSGEYEEEVLPDCDDTEKIGEAIGEKRKETSYLTDDPDMETLYIYCPDCERRDAPFTLKKGELPGGRFCDECEAKDPYESLDKS